MIETYAFFAVFAVQILAMSVLHPARLVKYLRAKVADYPAERYPQMTPNGFGSLLTAFNNLSIDRFVTLYRAVNAGIAVVGLLLLIWSFGYVQQTKWAGMAGAYFMLQMSPLMLLALIGLRYFKEFRSSMLEVKRTAVLQRRGLFDFVSPFAVVLAVLGYLLFVAYMIYLALDTKSGAAGAVNTIGVVTLVYAWNAFWMYRQLYGRKFNPLETHAGHVHSIGVGVKISVYSSIACVLIVSLAVALAEMDLSSWKPFITSAFLVTTGVVAFSGFALPPSKPDADGLDESPAK